MAQISPYPLEFKAGGDSDPLSLELKCSLSLDMDVNTYFLSNLIVV